MLPRRSAASLLSLVLLLPAAALAHDPGLSSLELRVAPDRVIADLTLAAQDAATARPAPGAFALEAIDVRIDGRRLDGAVAAIAEDAGDAIRIRLEYARAGGSHLTVTSFVPQRLARGHRELLSIRAGDGSRLVERLLDAGSSGVSIDLTDTGSRRGAERQSGGLVVLAAFLLVAVAGACRFVERRLQ